MARRTEVPRRKASIDLTVAAVPGYFALMAAEYWWIRRRKAQGDPRFVGFERRDTIASLAMGTGSLIVPLFSHRLLKPFTPGRGRFGRAVVGTTVGAAVVTTAADAIVRRTMAAPNVTRLPDGPGDPEPVGLGTEGHANRLARQVASAGGVVAVSAGALAVSTTWATRTSLERMWRRRLVGSLGRGPLPVALAVAGWDFIYYWNHRLMHESRYMWALHVVHHSSERYNLSTALRQPVAEALSTGVPYGLLCLLGIEPELVATARGVNLIYQYWIHTETLGQLGPAETVFNTASHHRVHHGSNRRYLDRNHGSILIVWDRLFGTFEPEGERVVYGLTKNINTFNVWRIAAHEYGDILRDVAGSTTWRERLSFVLRGPGWAGRRRAEKAGLTVDVGTGAPVVEDAVAQALEGVA